MNEDNFLKVAKKAAIEAGRVIQKYSSQIHQKSIKHEDTSDFATEADIESEKVIVELVKKNFPDHNIIAEEKNRIENASEYTWVVDPLDGTISFAGGLPYFSVIIGLLKNKKPLIGVIYNVMEEELYIAQRGKGAYLINKQNPKGKKIVVSKNDNLENALIDMDFGHRLQRRKKFNSYVIPLLEKVSYIYSIGSAIPFTLVAKGNIDACIDQGWIWDFAGSAILIEEAGGKVTDFEGKEPDWSKDRLSVVLSNGAVHDAILEALKR